MPRCEADHSPQYSAEVKNACSYISAPLIRLNGVVLNYAIIIRSVFQAPIPGGGWEFFSSPPCPERQCGPPILLPNGYRGALSLGVKRPGRAANYSSHI
jgi:hypothetical protein